MSVTKLQELVSNSLTLLIGAPGSGKSTFCQQMAVRAVAEQHPVIFVSTEHTIGDLTMHLQAQGLGSPVSGAISYVDAFSATVGVSCRGREDTECANCADLNTLTIAISKQRRKWPDKDILLVLDSLTSPYLFCGSEVVKFMRLFLSKLTVKGAAVVVAIDEGIGQKSDLVAMQSIADGIVTLDIQDSDQVVGVVKHPAVSPTTIERSIESQSWRDMIQEGVAEKLTPEVVDMFGRSFFGDDHAVRPQTGDFVNAIWSNMAHWSGMLWDPQRFPLMIYQHNREDQELTGTPEHLQFLPMRFRLMFKAMFASRSMGVLPRNFSDVSDMRKLWRFGFPYKVGAQVERSGIIQYLPDKSSRDAHLYRIEECSDCWGFDDVGATMASHLPPSMAGQLMAMEQEDRVWTAVETECIGLGDPHCEVILTPGESGEMGRSLVKDVATIEIIHERLTQQLVAFLLQEAPLVNRPTFGGYVHLQVAFHAFGFPKIAGHRATMAMRMGGAKLGSQVGERLLAAGLEPNQAFERFLSFLNFTRVGIAESLEEDRSIRITENIEPLHTWFFTDIREHSCYFTTGFFNGLSKSLTGQRVREIKCIAAGDPYCQWDIF